MTPASLRVVSGLSGAIVLTGLLVGFATDAHADPTKEECIAANENAQALRQSGKLRPARAELLACVVPSCPRVVRDDCAQRLDDLEKAIPTVVFTATGAAQADLSSVTVTMDGERLVDRLSGAPVSVEPGEHEFSFVASGYPTVVRKLVVHEGVKGRQEVIAFAPSTQVPIVAALPTPPLRETIRETSAGTSRATTQRTLAYVLAGVGAVGIGLGTYFGLRAKSTYDDVSSAAHCPTGPSSCDAVGVAGGQDAHGQATVSTIAFIAGGAMLAGGIVLALTAPKVGPVSVRPTAGTAGAGLRIGGTW